MLPLHGMSDVTCVAAPAAPMAWLVGSLSCLTPSAKEPVTRFEICNGGGTGLDPFNDSVRPKLAADVGGARSGAVPAPPVAGSGFHSLA